MALWVVRSESCCSLPSSLLLYARSLREKAIYNKLSYCIPQINLTVLKATVKVYSGACDSKTLSFHCCLIKVASEVYMCLASQTSFWTRNASSWSLYLLLFSVLSFYLVVICLLSFCLPDSLLPFAVVYNVLVDQFTVFCKGVSCSQHWGWWVVRWKAFYFLISNVVVNHIAGSVEASSWQASETCCFLYNKEIGGMLRPPWDSGKQILAVSAYLASLDHLFRNLVGVASRVSVIHDRGRLLTVRFQVILGQMPAQ